MTFAHPSYLWALTALAIPLAIHLLSRKEGKVIRVGSIRHVEESNTSQFKSIRLNEVLLLLLRMLMVALLALFMSGAQCSGPSGKDLKWVVVEKGINADSLVAKGYELHETPAGSYWSHVEELNMLPHEVVVISYSKVENFKGERIHLGENVKWITADPGQKEYQALAWQVGDSVFVRNARSNSSITSYSTSIGIPDSLKIIKPQQIDINTDDKVVVAALNVLKKEYRLPIGMSNDGRRMMNIEVVPGIGPLVERTSSTQLRINKKLDQDVALNDNLVIELFKVLYPELQQPQVSKDERTLPDEFLWSRLGTSVPPHVLASAGIEKYLILFFILSLAAERFVAIRRNQ
jgi:hypothetical protein